MAEKQNRVRRPAAIFAALTVAALMTACATAQANTVEVGSPLTGMFFQGPFAGQRCGLDSCFTDLSPVTVVPTQPFPGDLPEPGVNITSPVDGTVISYRLAAADGTFAIQVIRGVSPVPPHPPEAWGQSISTSAPAPISSPGVSPPVAANLAIKKDDSVGVRNFSVGNISQGFSDQIGFCLHGCLLYMAWYPPLADGAPQQDSNSYLGYGIGMQATVRYCQVPKLKGKSPKAARKALTAADCKVGKVTKTKKVRDKKQVLSQSVKPGKAVSDTKPIKLGLSRKQG